MLDNWLQTEKKITLHGWELCVHVKVSKEKILDNLCINKDNVEKYTNLTQQSHDAIVRKIKSVKLDNFPRCLF